jgi:large subunit ribosomal protein L7/L12
MRNAMTAKTHEKLIEQIGSMTVLELAELVKALEEKFGVVAAAPMASAAPVAAEGAASVKPEEKTEFKVTLKSFGANKIAVIKALRKVTTLGLTEAKQAVEEAPTVIGEAITKDKANEMKKTLEEAGAQVELS